MPHSTKSLINTSTRTTEAALQRLMEKVSQQPNGCWYFTGGITSKGYGFFWIDGMQLYAHRASYELLIGPIPNGVLVDHSCHNSDLSCGGGDSCAHRRCVNPAHLTPSDHKSNILGGRGVAARNSMKTHCPKGHEYDKLAYGFRACTKCLVEHQRTYRAKRRAVNSPV